TTITDPFGNRQHVGDLGLSPPAPPVIDTVDAGKPGSRAGLRGGDRIVAINGRAVADFEEVQRVVNASAGRPVTIGFLRGRARLDTQATPFRSKDGTGLLGIAFAVPRTVVHLDPISAFGAALEEVRQIVATTFRALFHSSAGIKQVSGFIGIAKVSGQVAQVSFVALIDLVALLSVSIGLVNLFPIPLLDGGHLLYYACEGVLGRPLGERAQDVGFRLGLAVVAGIFLLATWNDLLNLF
ncbi:MAG TPA: site-2 protease family protein, partial [Rhizomicrobium sp.]|nr:site-2 protease family protein [Rhizomicrobium sp.]